MNLILFTNLFPYKKPEPFLVTEFEIAKKYADSIKIFTLYGDPKDSIIGVNESIQCYYPVFTSTNDKIKLLLKGVFNVASAKFHWKEFFKKKIFLSLKKTYWFFVSMLITRAVLSSPSYKKLLKNLKEMNSATLYFYWGDNLCWIIPYLVKHLGDNHKIVMRLHNSDLYEYIKDDYAPLREDIFEISQSICTVSQNGKNYLSNRYPLYASKIYLSKLGVGDYGLNPTINQKEKVVVSVSNLVPLKRVHLIFETLQTMTTEITWHHFGDGPLLSEILNIISKARPGLHIKFHGHVKNNEILNFYKKNPINVFINVSSAEGIPVSIMEAFSFGIPVIATDVGGVSELVNSKTGILLDKDFTTNQLSMAINHLINSEKLIEDDYRKQARLAFIEKVSLTNYDIFYEKFLK
ncbi:MAG: glycosyltransferase [Bacteroidia bacterium]